MSVLTSHLKTIVTQSFLSLISTLHMCNGLWVKFVCKLLKCVKPRLMINQKYFTKKLANKRNEGREVSGTMVWLSLSTSRVRLPA